MANVWNLSDKNWLKQRRERWKGIHKQLKQFAIYELLCKRDIRYHKAYFLKGTLLDYDRRWIDEGYRVDKSIIGKPFVLNPIYKIWYHPIVDIELFQKWGGQSTVREKQRYAC